MPLLLQGFIVVPLFLFVMCMRLICISPLNVAAEDAPLPISSEVCKNCKDEIYLQRKGSMRVRSTTLADQIHATFHKKVIGSPMQEGIQRGLGSAR